MGSAASSSTPHSVNEADSPPQPLDSVTSPPSSSRSCGPAPPIIIITAPSRENLLAPSTGRSIEEANRERRPGNPVIVGRGFIISRA